MDTEEKLDIDLIKKKHTPKSELYTLNLSPCEPRSVSTYKRILNKHEKNNRRYHHVRLQLHAPSTFDLHRPGKNRAHIAAFLRKSLVNLPSEKGELLVF